MTLGEVKHYHNSYACTIQINLVQFNSDQSFYIVPNHNMNHPELCQHLVSAETDEI